MKSKFLFTGIILLFSSCISSKNGKMVTKNGQSNESAVAKSRMLDPIQMMNYVKDAPTVVYNQDWLSPYDSIQFDKVIAYDIGVKTDNFLLFKDERLINSCISKQQFLSQKQTDQLIRALTKKSTYGGYTAGCFEPKFAIVFFNDNKIASQINVCLDCNYYKSDIEIPAQNAILNKDPKNKKNFPWTGFSKKGRKRIIELCKELNFTYGNY